MKRWQRVFKSCKIGPHSKHSADIPHELGWLSLSEMRQHHMALMVFKVNHDLRLSYVSDMFHVNTIRLIHDLRSFRMNLKVSKAGTDYLRNSFASAGVKLWNSLPSSLKEAKRLFLNNSRLRSGRICYLNKHHNFSLIIRFNIVCDLFLE